MLNPEIDALRDSPFERLDALLAGAPLPAGRDPIMLSIGEPQHTYPDFVGEIIFENRHLYGRYPPCGGTAELRTAIADWLTRRYDLPPGQIAADRNVVTLNGTREGLFMAVQLAMTRERGSGRPLVLIPNPFYQCYVGAAIAAGAEPRFMPARPENDFLPDFAGLAPDVLARTAVAYLCTPVNPQGTMADKDYLRKAIDLAREYDFVLLVDECYAEIYDHEAPPGVLEVCGDDMTNVLAFHSLSKRSSVPGLRSGFAAGDPRLTELFLRLRNYGGAALSLPVCAAAAALWRDDAHVAVNRALYRAKLDAAEARLAGHNGFYRPPGGFFLWLEVGDGEATAHRLWCEAGLKVLPGAYLAKPQNENTDETPGDAYIRIALVQPVETIATAIDRLVESL